MSRPPAPPGPEPEPRVLRWSAPNAAAELQMRQYLLEQTAAGQLPEQAQGRGPVRSALVAASAEEAHAQLAAGEVLAGRIPGRPRRPVALLLPGQGAQQARMSAGLYHGCPVFTAAVDEVLAHFGSEGTQLRTEWLAGAAIEPAHRAQPLLFAINYALGQMVLSWGVRPAALLGHSVGEISAGALSGIFRVSDAAELLADRMASSAAAPPGGMLAVAASADQVTPFLSAGVAVGAVNAPRQTVLAGLDGPLDAAQQRLSEAGFISRRLSCNVAYHSPAAADIATGALPLLRSLPLRPPRLPLFSGYTAGWLSDKTAVNPGFWARHAVDPVLFWPALDALLRQADLLLVDVSPGQALAAAARRHPAVAAGRSAVTGLLPLRPGSGHADRRAALTAAARIWTEGHDVTLPSLDSVQPERQDRSQVLEPLTARSLPQPATIRSSRRGYVPAGV
jgi:[acyl-carrier-protein] S-malonyltransferase